MENVSPPNRTRPKVKRLVVFKKYSPYIFDLDSENLRWSVGSFNIHVQRPNGKMRNEFRMRDVTLPQVNLGGTPNRVEQTVGHHA
jgi:hypothetical protein